MSRSPRVLLVLAAALTLGAACRRAPESEAPAPAAPDAGLEAPPPSSSLVVTPLDRATTGYTNEMQAANLRRETSELGIGNISKHYEEGKRDESEAREKPPRLSEVERKERIKQLRDMTSQFTRMRRNIDAARDKSVVLEGTKPGLIPTVEKGGALEGAEEAPGRWSGLQADGVPAGARVVEAAEWKELWGRLSREDPPAVDFAASRVAAVFLGPRPTGGYRVRFAETVEGKDAVTVRWSEQAPGEGQAPPQGATSPWLLVAVPRDARPVRFQKAK